MNKILKFCVKKLKSLGTKFKEKTCRFLKVKEKPTHQKNSGLFSLLENFISVVQDELGSDAK